MAPDEQDFVVALGEVPDPGSLALMVQPWAAMGWVKRRTAQA